MTNMDTTGSAMANDYTMHWMGLFCGVLGSYQQTASDFSLYKAPPLGPSLEMKTNRCIKFMMYNACNR